jgi:hypothetical protein
LGTNYCWHIVDRAEGRSEEDADPDKYLAAAARYVKDMYAGGKSSLRPIHDALVSAGLALGSDVKICPCKTIVPFYRNHVFAEIKPRSRFRVGVGFALGGMEPQGSLIDTGGFRKKNRITHCIPLARTQDVNDGVQHWLRVAYEQDA